MPHLIPSETKELTGEFTHNPKKRPRRRPPKSQFSLGEPPAYFHLDEQVVWAELQFNAPATVLTRADRHQIEVICHQVAKLRRREATAADIGMLLKALSSCGLNPVDRQRVQGTGPDTKAENPFSEFQ